MPFTTTVTPDVIAIAAGKPAPPGGSPTEQQWEMWISDAVMLISNRAATLDIDTVDQATLDYVVREAVTDHVKRPDNATQVTVSVDDASTSRTYRSGRGRVTITDEWWTDLGLTTPDGAFSIDLLPSGYTLGGS